ncbi:hypothetical protein CL621_00890, partial [archaeon]|nr:hypothetical protein [archaeon]
KGFISTLMNSDLGGNGLGDILDSSAHMYSLKNLENNEGRCENPGYSTEGTCEGATCTDANGDRPCRWNKWGRYEHFIPAGVDITNLRFFAALTSIHPSGNDQGGIWLPVRGFLEMWEVDETDFYDDAYNNRTGDVVPHIPI